MRGFIERLPLYVGGFMGPFGTIVIIPMYPELREEFSASTSQVSLAFSLYLIPFAVFLLFSGTIGERLGRRRTVRATYLLYAAASLLAAIAPSLPLFIAARALAGIGNAFITPLLVAGLAELVPADRLGREVGIYSSFQALGGGLGPVLGGIAADTNWKLAFFGTAAIAGLLALAPPPGEPRTDADAMPRLRPLLTKQMVMLGVAFLFLATGPIGIGVLVGLAARDVLELSGTAAGVVLFLGSMTALVLGPLWGRVLDRHGPRTVGLTAVGLVSVATASLILANNAVSLALIWAVVSALTVLTVIVFQALGASLMPENRGGALSFLLSFRFLGHALGPILLVPVIERNVDAAFLIAAALGIVPLVLVALGLGARTTASDPPG